MERWNASLSYIGVGARISDGKGTGLCGMDVEDYYYHGICIVYYDSIMGKIFCDFFWCLYTSIYIYIYYCTILF